MNPTLTYYGRHVRTYTASAGQPGGQDYEVVEELVGTKWIERKRWGHMSSDYALTNARQYAQSLATKHIGGH